MHAPNLFSPSMKTVEAVFMHSQMKVFHSFLKSKELPNKLYAEIVCKQEDFLRNSSPPPKKKVHIVIKHLLCVLLIVGRGVLKSY